MSTPPKVVDQASLPSSTTYTVQYAKSGAAKCRRCLQCIRRNTIRVCFPLSPRSQWQGFYHLECWAPVGKTPLGLDTLRRSDRDKVIRYCGGSPDAPDAPSPTTVEDEKEGEEEEDYPGSCDVEGTSWRCGRHGYEGLPFYFRSCPRRSCKERLERRCVRCGRYSFAGLHFHCHRLICCPDEPVDPKDIASYFPACVETHWLVQFFEQVLCASHQLAEEAGEEEEGSSLVKLVYDPFRKKYFDGVFAGTKSRLERSEVVEYEMERSRSSKTFFGVLDYLASLSEYYLNRRNLVLESIERATSLILDKSNLAENLDTLSENDYLNFDPKSDGESHSLRLFQSLLSIKDHFRESERMDDESKFETDVLYQAGTIYASVLYIRWRNLPESDPEEGLEEMVEAKMLRGHGEIEDEDEYRSVVIVYVGIADHGIRGRWHDHFFRERSVHPLIDALLRIQSKNVVERLCSVFLIDSALCVIRSEGGWYEAIKAHISDVFADSKVYYANQKQEQSEEDMYEFGSWGLKRSQFPPRHVIPEVEEEGEQKQ